LNQMKEKAVPSTVERLSDTRVKITMTVPFEELRPAVDKAYKEIARRINLPGFRKGHVPSALIDQRFGREAVIEQALNEQLPDLYNAAVAENKLSPLGQPDIDVAKMEDGQPVEVTAEVDVRPDFEVPDVSQIAVTVDPAGVGDAEVDERVNLLRTRFATYNDLDRAAAKDDVVDIDIALGESAAEDLGMNGVSYVVGAGGLLDGLDKAVTGLKAGESKTFVTKVEGDNDKIDATVTVNKVRQRVLPRVDDDFAQLVSEYDTADEMLAGLRDGLERMGRLAQAGQARDKVLDAVIEQTAFELPPKVLEDEIAERRQDIENQLARAGLSVERYLAQVPDETAKTADEFWGNLEARTERGLKARLVLDKVAEDEEVAVSQEDLSEYIVAKAQEEGVTPDQEAQHMMQHGHTQEWLGEIRRGKALSLLVARASVKDTDGRRIDISRIRGDGTLGEMTSAEVAGAAPAGKPAKTAKARSGRAK